MIKRTGASLLLMLSIILAFGQKDTSIALFGGKEGVVEIEILFEVHKPKIKGFNTEFDEFAPVLYNGNLVYTSDRDYHYHALGEDAWSKTKFHNIFTVNLKAVLDSSGRVRPRLFADELLINDNCGPISFSPDGTEAFITMAPNKRVHRKNDHHLHLYHSVATKGKWHNFDLPFPQTDYAYGQGCLSTNGKKLYFVAELPGGIGGKDIYYVERGDSATQWSDPVLLGNNINSEADELFPYMYRNDLYFSSNREGGFGGLDLYRVPFKNNEFQQVENLGETINTSENEYSLVFDNDMGYAFFASDRDGNDDIFYAEVIVQVKKKSMEGTFEYKYLKGEYPSGLEVLLIDDEGNVIFRTTTGENGDFKFDNLPPDGNYTLKLVGNTDDVVVKIIDGDKEIYLLSNEQGEFLYRKLDAEDVGTLSLMEVEDGEMTGKLSGQFVFDKLPSEKVNGMVVYLVDDDGNIVMQTTTDEFGNFNFENLPTDKNYRVKMVSEEDISLVIFNENDDVIAKLKQNKEGIFIFKRLNADYNQTLLLMNEEDVSSGISQSVFGQFKRKDTLPILSPIKFEIYLAETKDFLMKSITDAKGFFRLTNLPADKKLLYKVVEEDGNIDNFTLILKDRNGEKIIEMIRGEDKFYYEILDADINNISTVNSDDTEMVNSNLAESGLGDQIPAMYFEKNSSYISEDMLPGLSKIIDIMKNNPSLKVDLVTHSDARGDVGYNLWITERRSQRLAQYLIDHGIAQDRIKTQAKGESELVNSCYDESECTEEEHRQNRVVDVIFY